MNRTKATALVFLTSLLTACQYSQAPSPFLRSEPESNSVLTRAPQTLRLFYQQLPDVERSEVVLEGPAGPLELRGLHTMGANDLMMEINDQVIEGIYTVRWTTVVGDDPHEYRGEYQFTFRPNQ